jgi:ubiquinone/menaquinone biosynthesis C-methylase UbiE
MVAARNNHKKERNIMPDPLESDRNELASTYFVEDRQNKEELTRLTIQDQMLTQAMGGVLAEQPDPTIFRQVLDVACGPGGWAIDAAQAYPEMYLVGIDISSRMINYARKQAKTEQVADRVEFRVMDVLRLLEFPDESFDLVNMRFSVSFMRTWNWPKMLSELQRVTRSGGVIRLTETDIIIKSNSAAFTQLNEMFLCALFRSGHLFAAETTGITAHLSPLLSRHGVKQVQTKAYAPEYRAGTPEGEAYCKNIAHAYRTLRPFLQHWGCLAKEYDVIYQQALDEMQQSDFHATWDLLSAWGHKP